MTAVDVTSEARAEQSVARATLVTEITERMNASVDPDAALQALTDRLVPAVADLAGVYVISATPPEGGPLPPAQAVAFTLGADLLASAGPPPPPSPREGPSPWDAALAAGRTVLIDVAEPPRGEDRPRQRDLARGGGGPQRRRRTAGDRRRAGRCLAAARGRAAPALPAVGRALPRGRDCPRRCRGGAPAQLSAAAPDRPEPAASPAAEHAAFPARLRRGRPVRRRQQRRRGRRRLVGRPPPRRRTDRHRGG